MKEKGYKIIGEPCRGKVCGVNGCPLFKRRAEKLRVDLSDKEMTKWFDNLDAPVAHQDAPGRV